MALERKDNDDQMEKLRMEADDVAAKVGSVPLPFAARSNISFPDGRTSEEERGGA
jgi:hypothetical protein